MMRATAGERIALVSQSLEDSFEAFTSPDVIGSVGLDRATQLGDLVSRAVVVEVDDGVAHMPEGVDSDTVLPIIPLHRGEEVKIGPDLAHFSSTQLNNAIRTVESWEPKPGTVTAETYIDDVSRYILEYGHFIYSIPANAGGYVSGAMAHFQVNHNNFDALPDGFAQFSTRPLLGMRIDLPFTPDALAHELVHHDQWQQNPILYFNSQESIEMALLRMELEGYECGAYVRAGLEGGKMPKVPYSLQKIFEQDLVQVAIERVRARNNAGNGDPYRPTPKILREIRSSVGAKVIHNTIDYNKVISQLSGSARYAN